jgi:AcrR family transcriptional regulator
MMVGMARPKTREEILTAAARLFASVGYKGTSLQDIADDVGCSKATLLYHFMSKHAILAELIGPPVRELAILDEELASLADAPARDLAIERLVNLVLGYRREIAVIYHDLPHLFELPDFVELKQMIDRLVAAIAGRSTDPAAIVGAHVVLAGIATVVIDRAEVSDDDLRPALIGVARRALIPSD